MIVCGLEPVFVECLLHLPHLFAGRGAVGLEVVFVDGVWLGGYLYGLETIDARRVLQLQNKAGQTTELPRAGFHGDVGREPRHESTAPPVARGLLAAMTENSLRFRAHFPLL